MQYAVLLALALFFGFAFEEFYSEDLPDRPGGVRTFPLLAFLGGALYLIEPHFALAFIAGLLVTGAWLYGYVRADVVETSARIEGPFIIPAAVLAAYALGPIALTQPLWLSVGYTVLSVLLLGSRKPLHALIQRVPKGEVLTAGQFLLLVGVVLPLLYHLPRIPHTGVTPVQLWLAVVAVSTLSYASYLLQRYAFPQSGVVIAGVLGGLYSSTATTVVLARRARERGFTKDVNAAIVAASAMMYFRILIICAIFALPLARVLAPPLTGIGCLTLAVAWLLGRGGTSNAQALPARNPLQLGTAIVFAALLLGVSLLTTIVARQVGSSGIFALAALVGLIDVDPFVLSIAQGTANVALATGAAAILVAASSNNVLKAIYAGAFSLRVEAWKAAATLTSVSLVGLLLGWIMAR